MKKRSPEITPPASGVRGKRILVTRPAAQAEALCQLIEQAGGECGRLPLLAIDSEGDAAAQRLRLCEALAWDAWIFTSANAARAFAGLDPLTVSEQDRPAIYAIGAATAAAVRDAGFPRVRSPEGGSSSEALLELAELRDVRGHRFMIVTGAGGRDHLASTLRARGAEVETIALYRRRPLNYEASRVEAEIAIADAIVVTSGEGLDQLWKLTEEALRPMLRHRKLVLPSQRVVEKAVQEYGFESLRVPADLSDQGVLDCLSAWLSPAEASMNETPITPEPTAAPPSEPASAAPGGAPAGGRPAAVLPWMLCLLLSCGLGFAAWHLWHLQQRERLEGEALRSGLTQLQLQTRELESQAATLTGRQTDLARSAQRSNLDLTTLQERFDQSDQVLGRISEELLGGRTRFQLSIVEQLLVNASDRLLLERDVPAAVTALEISDRRLAALNEPRLYKVREAISEERAALMAVPRVDLTSATLSLSSLINRAPQLPLRSAPDRLRSRASANAHSDAEDPWYWRLWDATAAGLKQVFVIRRDDNAKILRLLPPEQQAAAYQILILRLEAARVALLRSDTPAFRSALQSADAWLGEYFRQDDPGVLAASGEFSRLATLDLRPPLPTLGASLDQLRAVLAVEHP